MDLRGHCERCAELEEQVAWLKSELGEMQDASIVERLHSRYGITRTEAKFLAVLEAANGRIVTHQRLFDLLDCSGDGNGTLKVYAYEVRKKLGADAVFTSWGQGFAIGPAGAAAIEAARAGS